jgi:hypothetical protein
MHLEHVRRQERALRVALAPVEINDNPHPQTLPFKPSVTRCWRIATNSCGA